MAQKHQPVLGALALLCITTTFISSRYYISPAFERPCSFSILTLLLAGSSLYGWSNHIVGRGSAYSPIHATSNNGSKVPRSLPHSLQDLLESLSQAGKSTSIVPLTAAIASRVILYWWVTTRIHCTVDGLTSFLPLTLLAFEACLTKSLILPQSGHDTRAYSKRLSALLSHHVVTALIWGLAATDTLILSERRTGAVCPPHILERTVPLVQLMVLGCDAYILVAVMRLRHHHEDKDGTWRTFTEIFFGSAGLLIFVGLFSWFIHNGFRCSILLDSFSVTELVDSCAVVAALLSGIFLLAHLPATAIALVIAAINILVHIQLRILDSSMIKVWSSVWGITVGVVLFFCTGALLQWQLAEVNLWRDGNDTPIYKNRFGGAALLIFVLFLAQTILVAPNELHSQPIRSVISKARVASNQWIAGAKQSQTLDQAAAEYRHRYGLPPPPNFDKWYEYAVSVDSPIMDNFNQIHSDLTTFWGVPPAVLRQMTVYLLERPILSFGGLIIESGSVQVSPHIHGTHRWMMDVMKDMVEPFAQWLPDMQLAFNLDDECRVSVPFEEKRVYLSNATRSQARLASQNALRGFSEIQQPQWPRNYLDEENDLWNLTSPWFENWSKAAIFTEWIPRACPLDSLVNTYHWWNRKTACSSCSAAHMTDGVISQWDFSADLCHQPDLAQLHGALSAPSAMGATHHLFPVFSQSRLGSFVDILYPSPWNFADKVSYDNSKTISWERKLNSVFWRGAASDGYATHGSWKSFLRARFVNLATQASSALRSSSLFGRFAALRGYTSPIAPFSENVREPITVNVSFVGPFNRCDEEDCKSEHATFYGSPTAESPAAVDFQDHWHYRHLIDMDGAGFSGRFYVFLKSNSLPYRAALYRTWWEERVHAWRHFVPLDVRLGDLWKVVSHFSGVGDKEAKRIAVEGKQWAERALRKEDMRVYMFRLLLEWGRLVDDRREQLGYAAT